MSIISSKPDEPTKDHTRPCPLGCTPLGGGVSGNTRLKPQTIPKEVLEARAKQADDYSDITDTIDFFKLHGIDPNG